MEITPATSSASQLYSALLTAHNLVRWAVLLAAIWAAFRGWRGMLGRLPWSQSDLAAGKLYANFISLQLVVGVCLYATSPLTRQAMSDMGTAMRTPSVRYFAVEHVTIMLVAIALAHIGLARVKRAPTDASKFQTAAIWWGLSAGAVIGFIPWSRPLFPGM